MAARGVAHAQRMEDHAVMHGVAFGFPGARSPRGVRIAFTAGTTIAQLAASMPCAVRAYWGGREIPEEEWGQAAPAGVVLMPAVGWSIVVSLVVGVISALVAASMAKDAAQAALRDAQHSEESGSANFRGAASTRYGRGWPVPIVLGRFRASGHVIALRVDAAPWAWGDVEVLHAIVLLSEGPIARVGNEDGGPFGERDEMGTLNPYGTGPREIPTGLRMDGVDLTAFGTEVSVRMGRNAQSRLPKWPFAVTTEAINAELSQESDERIVTVEQTQVEYLAFTLDFPAGLYRQAGSNRASYSVTFTLETRLAGSGPWTVHQPIVVVDNRARPLAWRHEINVARGGPYQIKIRRTTPAGDPGQVVSQCLWRSVQSFQVQSLTYPGCALLSISRTGEARSTEQRPEFSAQVDGLLVRGWDAATGWTEPTWDAVSPWIFPLGRNPAWIALRLLTDRDFGVANEIMLWLGGSGDEEIDLPRFREWADFCDLPDPTDPTRAHLEFNHAIDTVRPAMEWLLAIFRAGHAIPILEGGRLSVHYEYRDAHGRGTVSVPAREAYQILSSTNLEACELIFRDPSSLPNIMEVEFFDEANDYQPDVVTVSDDSRLVVPYVGGVPRVIVERVSAVGPTSRAAARREAWYQLQWMRQTVEARLRGGLSLATITVGDVFWLQHDCWTPSDYDGETGAMRTVTDSPDSDVTSVVVDRTIVAEAPARSGTALFIADTGGRARLFTIDGTGTYAAGASIPLWDPVANGPPTGFRCARDATVAWGTFGTFERRMKVVSMSLTADYRVELVAHEWPESAFTAPPEESTTDDGATLADPLSAEDAMPIPPAPSPRDLEEPTPTLAIGARGEPMLAWATERTEGQQHETGSVRVWSRLEGGAWRLLAEARGTSTLADDLEVGRWHQVAVAAPRLGGGYPAPDDAEPVLVLRPELWGDQLPAPTGLAATVSGLAVSLSWGTVAGADGYEIRRGAAWMEATTLSRPTTAAAALTLGPGTHRLMVRARGASGRWGAQATVSVVVAEPMLEIASLAELPTVAGAHDGTAIVSGTLRLQAGAMRGVYTAPALDAGALAELSWSAIVDGDAVEVQTIGEDTGRIGDDYGHLVAGRQATALSPGTAGVTIGEDTGTIGGWAGQEIRQGISALGERTSVRLEARWHDGSTWSSWAAWDGGPTRREAKQMQVRAVLRRQHPRWRIVVDKIEMRASA